MTLDTRSARAVQMLILTGPAALGSDRGRLVGSWIWSDDHLEAFRRSVPKTGVAVT